MILELPAELVSRVVRFSRQEDVPTIALACKYLSKAAVPHLYSTISLQNASSTLKCLTTLSSSDRLAGMVRSFTIEDFGSWSIRPPLDAQFHQLLVKSIEQMTNLQHYACGLLGYNGPAVIAALTISCAPTLQSLSLALVKFTERDRIYTEPATKLRPEFPKLVDIDVNDYSEEEYPESYASLIRHIIGTAAKQLRSLKVIAHYNFEYFFGDVSGLPSLEKLTIAQTSLGFPCLAQTPKVDALEITVGNDFSAYQPPAGSFPVLNRLTCPVGVLGAILSASESRPVRIVELSNSQLKDEMEQPSPAWPDVLQDLQDLPHSSGPVTDLTFHVGYTELEELPRILPYIAHLKSLKIHFFEDPGNLEYLSEMGEEFFAHLPNLENFILSDDLIHDEDDSLRFLHADDESMQREVLEEWDNHTQSLKCVAFTSQFCWYKGEDGWVAGVSADQERNEGEKNDEDDDQSVHDEENTEEDEEGEDHDDESGE